jgi:metallo-beta-lactamase class B
VPAAAAAPVAPACAANAKWTDPATPFKVQGNTWFVGTCGLSSILIASTEGHVLLDGTIEEAAPLIEASIRRLGFRVEDVHYIVTSHEHYDHVGGVANLQRDSGATVVARPPAAAALERGRGDRSDPQFLGITGFTPIGSVRRIDDGGEVRVGPIVLTAHATPGHTPGSTSWTWQSCEKHNCLHLVYADSLSAISDDVYRYSDEAQNPGVVAAFRHSIELIAALPCDILLTPHPDASAMWTRFGAAASASPIEEQACRRYATNAAQGLDARLAKEHADLSH